MSSTRQAYPNPPPPLSSSPIPIIAAIDPLIPRSLVPTLEDVRQQVHRRASKSGPPSSNYPSDSPHLPPISLRRFDKCATTTTSRVRRRRNSGGLSIRPNPISPYLLAALTRSTDWTRKNGFWLVGRVVGGRRFRRRHETRCAGTNMRTCEPEENSC